MINYYDALNKAADHIEQHPRDFNFLSAKIPESLGTKACALGWIGYFAGAREGYAIGVGVEVLGHECEFFQSITDLAGSGWMSKPEQCAKGMRLYAETYLSWEKRPVWAQMRDREFQARLDAAPAYGKFRQELDLTPLLEVTPENKGALNHIIRDWSEE